MRELLRTTNPVRVSFLRALLAAEDIELVELDAYISAVEGSIGAFPRRLVVEDEDYDRAVRVLKEAGEHW